MRPVHPKVLWAGLVAGLAIALVPGTAQVIVTTHAVQSANNTLSCTVTPAAGSPCAPNGSFKWS